MKIDKVKINSGIALLIGFIGSAVANRADELARDEMKKEIEEDVLKKLEERDS